MSKRTFARLGACMAGTACLAVWPLFSGPVPDSKPPHYPDWWFERDVIRRVTPGATQPQWPTDYRAADDFAVANQGQVKHIAQQAYAELFDHGLVAESGPLAAMIAGWTASSHPDRDDFRAINLGQLKYLAKPFYDQLDAIDYSGRPLSAGRTYPWDDSTTPVDDYAVANIGQVKHLFSFNVLPYSLVADSDGDGVVNGWERTHGLDPFDPADLGADEDGDGWNALMEYFLGQNPLLDERAANPRIVAGADQSLWRNVTAGTSHVWGRNTQGQLAQGDAATHAQIRALSALSGGAVVAATWGGSFGLAVAEDCHVYSWGDNRFGQLGDGTTTARRSPNMIAGLDKVVQIAAGDHHALALRGDGTVWAWGGNYRGQLGDGTIQSRLTPAVIPGLSRVIAIAAGASHSVALDTEGRVWIWGANDLGQLADSSSAERLAPAQVAGLGAVAKIASGRHHLLALERAGALRAWGANQAGQLGIGTRIGQTAPQLVSIPTGVRSIAAGDNHSLALATDGTLWSWGANDVGQLGDNSANVDDPVPAATALSNIIQIAAGRAHALALGQDGQLVGWGLNHHGQVSAASTAPILTPVNLTVP